MLSAGGQGGVFHAQFLTEGGQAILSTLSNLGACLEVSLAPCCLGGDPTLMSGTACFSAVSPGQPNRSSEQERLMCDLTTQILNQLKAESRSSADNLPGGVHARLPTFE